MASYADRARALVEHSPDALLVIDRGGRLTEVNAATERLFRRDRDELVGLDHAELMAPGFTDTFAGAFDELGDPAGATATAEPRQAGSALDVFARDAHGRTFPVEVNYAVLPGADPASAEIVATVRDVSERHRSETRLRQALSLLAATLESTADGILVVSSDGTIAGYNSRFVEMWGIPEDLMESGDDERVMGFVLDQLADVDAFVAKVMALYQHPDDESHDVLDFKDGRTFERYSRPQRVDDAIVGRVWSFRDVTPRVQAQREAEEARASALEASRAKSDFLATMSHEIRTPMNGVIGLTGLLLNTDLDDRQRRYAAGVRGAGEALLGIVDDILDFSKLEAGKVSLESVAFSPRHLLEEVGVLLSESATTQGLRWDVRCDPDVPAAVTGDPGRVRQALINLAGNAIKFTPEGEVVVSVDVEGPDLPEAIGELVSLRFEVRDTGIGIDEETIGRLFQPFSQADASTTRKFGGTGLGLAISSRLVQAMGGELEVDSEVGVGSTFGFTVRLPVAAEVASEGSFNAVRRAGDPHDLRGPSSTATELEPRGRVLVAEDNPVNQMVALGFLEELGYRCDLVADGEEVLTALSAAEYDLVLMDCHMPGMDGFEATKRLRATEVGRHTPVVAMTAGVLDEDRERCLAVGMDDFVAKPIDRDHLRETLDRWIGVDIPVEVPVLDDDRLALLRKVGKADGWGVLPDVVRLFLGSVPALRTAIDEAAAARDAQGLARAVHGLKGSAANLGAMQVAEACLAVEDGIHATGRVPDGDELGSLEHALEASCRALEHLLAHLHNG